MVSVKGVHLGMEKFEEQQKTSERLFRHFGALYGSKAWSEDEGFVPLQLTEDRTVSLAKPEEKSPIAILRAKRYLKFPVNFPDLSCFQTFIGLRRK